MAEKAYYRVVGYFLPTDYFQVLIPIAWSTAGFHGLWAHPSVKGEFRPYPPGAILPHLNLKSADGLRRRNFPIDDQGTAGFPWLGQTISLPNANGTFTTWTVVGYTGQRFQPAKYRIKKR